MVTIAGKRFAKRFLATAGRALPVRPGCRALVYHTFDGSLSDVAEELTRLKAIARPVTCGQLLSALHSRDSAFFSEPTFVVTIDDGYLDVYTRAAPLFADLSIFPVLFVASDWLGFDGKEPDRSKRYFDPANKLTPGPSGEPRAFMSWTQLQELHRSGWDIGSHTRSHTQLTHPKVDLDEEIFGSRRVLEQNLATEIQALSFPHGLRHHISLEALTKVREAGYKACFSCSSGTVTIDSDPYFLNRDVVDTWWSPRMIEGSYRGALDRFRSYAPPSS